ncbi:MAG: hypothetical protein M3O35_21090 [Acidobacteriota bacterium]|nr:hypothetical protein [Acidobacteriota bacterium]
MLRTATWLTLVYTLLVTIPSLPVAPGVGLDASWKIGLNAAHVQGLAPGTDVIFTFGPAGYLFVPLPGYAEKWPVLGTCLALWLLLAFAWVQLRRAMGASIHWLCLLAAFTVSYAIGKSGVLGPDYIQITAMPLALILMLPDARLRLFEFSLLGVLAGFASLVKLSTGVEIMGVYYACLCVAAARSRSVFTAERVKLLFLAALPIASVTVWYAVFTHNLFSLLDYLWGSLEIVQGYSSGMAISGPAWQFVLALATIAILFAGIPLAAQNRRALLPGLIPAALWTFMAFKEAMVRQDLHAVWFPCKLALVSLFVLVLVRPRRDQLLILGFQTACLLSAVVQINSALPDQIQVATARLNLSLPSSSAAAFLNWNATWKDLDQASRQGMAPAILPSNYTSIVGQGTVEAVGWSIATVVANGWKWRPRPVMQTYSAYTPHLDFLNASHVNSTKAADYAYLTWGSIDDRHVFLEDPASWRATLDWYDFAVAETYRGLLKRRKSPRYGAPVPLGSSIASWGRPTGVPPGGGVVIAYANVTQSAAGKLRQFAYRGTAVYLRVNYRSGRNQLFRTVSANLDDGFIIDPFPDSLLELPDLMGPLSETANRVSSITFETPRAADFVPAIEIRWAWLPLLVPDVITLPGGSAERHHR